MQDTQQQHTLCDQPVEETAELPAPRGAAADPTPPSKAPEPNAAEGTGRMSRFVRILLRALGAWPA